MDLGRKVKVYFAHLDAGEAEDAAAMFAPGGRVDAPWEAGIAPDSFIGTHLASAPARRHEILDLLVSETGQSAAVHFVYRSRGTDGQDNPSFAGCDHFRFTADGKIETLSVYCHARHADD